VGRYPSPVQIFFETVDEVKLFLKRLDVQCCPFCRATGVLVRHGYLRWRKGPKAGETKGWRIRCKGNSRNQGCGRTYSIQLGQTLLRRYLNADEFWTFLQALLTARSIKQAWETATLHKGFPTSLSNTYKLVQRLSLCQSTLRTRLSGRSPPPKAKAGVPLLHVLAHLKAVFGSSAPISAYQLSFQRDFLAAA
jgi:hypothetical protein